LISAKEEFFILEVYPVWLLGEEKLGIQINATLVPHDSPSPNVRFERLPK
jgi:hypothetical protein